MRPEWYVDDSDKPEDERMDEAARAGSLHIHCSQVEERQSDVHENNLLYGQLYYNRTLDSFHWGDIIDEGSLSPISRLSESLVTNVVDSFFNNITKNKVQAAVMLSEASFSVYRRGRQLGKFLQSVFRTSGYRVMEEMFVDAALFGFGAVKVDMEPAENGEKKVCLTRLFPDDVIIDQRECHGDAQPIHVFYRRIISRDSACRLYGLDEDLSRIASKKQHAKYRSKSDDNITIIEGWRCAYLDPEGKEVPGRHVISTPNQVLLDEEFCGKTPPIVFFRWKKPSSGWYGPSLVEEVFPYQIRLNEVNEVIRESQDLMIRPRLLVPFGCKISVEQVDNEIGKFIWHTPGSKPEAVVWQGVSPELYAERDRVVKSCYEFVGLSQLSAQAKMPDGARYDSSLAIRAAGTQVNSRHAKKQQAYEQLAIDLAEMIIRVCSEEKAEVTITYVPLGKTSLTQTLNFSDIEYEKGRFQLYLEPASVMNETPSARQELLLELLGRKVISEARYAYLSASPDLDREKALLGASEEDIEHTIEMLLDGKRVAPGEFSDLVGGMATVQRALLYYDRFDDFPEDVRDGFTEWLLQADALIPPPPPPPAPMPMPPMDMQAPLPVPQ